MKKKINLCVLKLGMELIYIFLTCVLNKSFLGRWRGGRGQEGRVRVCGFSVSPFKGFETGLKLDKTSLLDIRTLKRSLLGTLPWTYLGAQVPGRIPGWFEVRMWKGKGGKGPSSNPWMTLIEWLRSTVSILVCKRVRLVGNNTKRKLIN